MTGFPSLPVLDELTEPERELLEAARHGRPFATDAPVRALVVRELLLGRRGPLDPRGVRLEGGRVVGSLDLDHADAVTGLALSGCTITGPLTARYAQLPWLDLSGSRLGTVDLSGARVAGFADFDGVELTGDSGAGEDGAIRLRDARIAGRTGFAGAKVANGNGPALYLDGLECGELRAGGLRARGAGVLGAVRLPGARVSGRIDFDGAELTNDSGPALSADGLVVDGDARLDSAALTGAGDRGAVHLIGARVGGEADFSGAVVANGSGPAVVADDLRAGALRLTRVTATAAGEEGAVSLLGARIDGQVNAGGAVLTNTRGRALSADGLHVDDSFHADGLTATGAGVYGAICLMSAQVGGHLYLEGAELGNGTGAALSGDRLRVEGSLSLGELKAAGSGEPGTVRLVGASIGGQVNLQGARITNDAGSAVYADGLHVGSILYLSGARLSGAGPDGALRLHNAEVTGQLLLGGAELANSSGPALSADDVRVGTYLDLTGLTATCSSDIGALSLSGARVGGQFALADAELANEAGPALFADRCRIRDSLLTSGLRAAGTGELGTIRLLGAHIGGQLNFTGAEVVNRDELTAVSLEDAVVEGSVFFPIEVVGPRGLVYLDGFRFGSLGDVTWREWLHLIRAHTAAYRPGPFQWLAAAERAAGHDGNARHVLIAQQRDLRRRAPEAIGGWPARRFHGLWGALAGYGYRARRTAAALLLAVIAAGGLGLWAGQVGEGGHRAAERTSDLTAKAGTPCTTVELIGVGLDRGLPLSPGVRGRCDLNTGTGAGQVFTVAIWAVQAAIWALATLALVGYTGLMRKAG